ncbi:barstar family protein [Anaerofilum sp. BX8]|uniref:Barstar family protein n=1 Tax=Anaerofilum hominis TaxID=2763016 RepID=A0A923I7Y1_9FIRM|nr:barstar family protein [Anaerofilum hominis]MBC5579898.1 barstar family protein [Anaerofilum hominis]
MNYYEEEKRNAFKAIEENPIVLDFKGCRYLGEVHLMLKQKFGLPEYYGENWDALWDCLDGLFIGQGNYLVQIKGFSSMPQELQQECVKMLEVFDDVHAETPSITFQFLS